VAANHRFTEGPAWSHEGFLIFSDIPNNRILKLIPGKGTEVFRDSSGGANGNAFDSRGRLYTCEGGARRVTRTDNRGKVEPLVSVFEGKAFHSPNDIAIRRDGHIYFTDPAFGSAQDKRELPFYGVYHVTPKGEAEVFGRFETRPNGIAFSPNQRILYVSDSDERLVRAWDVERDGKASNPRVVITGIEGVPDGLKTDQAGNLYIACKGLAIYSPGGKLLRFVEMPETPSNLTFGDPDLKTLYVTARTSVYRIRMPVQGWSVRDE